MLTDWSAQPEMAQLTHMELSADIQSEEGPQLALNCHANFGTGKCSFIQT